MREMYTCTGDNFCRGHLANTIWVPFIDFGDLGIWYTCAGDEYCRNRYGGGSWEEYKFQDMLDYKQVTYACGGIDFCKAVYGAGEWVYVEYYGEYDYFYGCGGDTYCQYQYGENSVWKTPAETGSEYGGCYTNGSFNGYGGEVKG